jgi:acetyltransferase-like isoleucine patch superfamily enzyme
MNIRRNRFLRTLYYYYCHYRNKHSYNIGSGNKIVCKGVRVKSRFQIKGLNNTVVVEPNAVCLDSLIRITGNNNTLILKADSYITEVEIFIENAGCKVEVGESTFIGRHTHIACTEDGSEIQIGGNGMISSYCQIRTGDSHSVIVNGGGGRINHSASVALAEHCWLGEGSRILKGVHLGKDTVVSTGAIVTKSFPANVLIGGIPAKVLKENISWDKNRL